MKERALMNPAVRAASWYSVLKAAKIKNKPKRPNKTALCLSNISRSGPVTITSYKPDKRSAPSTPVTGKRWMMPAIMSSMEILLFKTNVIEVLYRLHNKESITYCNSIT